MNNNIWTNHMVFAYSWRTIHGIFSNISRIPYGILWSVQRMTKGYANCDIWNFDEYLGRILVFGMRELAECTWGFPDRFKSLDAWQKALLDSAAKIEAGMGDDWEPGEDIREYHAKKKALLEEGLNWVVENFRSLWD